MKKIFLVISIIVSINATAQVEYNEQYDTNKDGIVDVADITALVTYMYSHPEGGGSTVSATMHPCTEKPSWTNSSSLYYSSMCIYVLDGSLPKGLAIGEGDIIAAFIGGECRCATAPTLSGGVWRYNMSIGGGEDDPADATVEIRYYSAAKKAYCISAPITFVDGEILGSQTQGYTISWK